VIRSRSGTGKYFLFIKAKAIEQRTSAPKTIGAFAKTFDGNMLVDPAFGWASRTNYVIEHTFLYRHSFGRIIPSQYLSPSSQDKRRC